MNPYNLTEQQRRLASDGTATISLYGKSGRVNGKIGTLEHFGFVVDTVTQAPFAGPPDRQVTRKASKRQRWLGDPIGTSVKEYSYTRNLYASRRGTAKTGRPIWLQNLDTGDRWEIQLEGSIMLVHEAIRDAGLSFGVQVYGFTGNRYLEPIMPAAAGPGGTTQTAASGQTGQPVTVAPLPAPPAAAAPAAAPPAAPAPAAP